jgi:hypothetical protein
MVKILRPLSGTTIAVAAAALALAGLTAGPARAVVQDNLETFVNQGTRLCLEGLGSGAIRTSPCEGVSTQKWSVHVRSDGARELRNARTGQCLDDSDSFGLRTHPCNSGTSQRWIVHGRNHGTVELRNRHTQRCVEDRAGSEARTYPCDGGTLQSWY